LRASWGPTGSEKEEEEKEEALFKANEEESLFKANAVNEEDSERDSAALEEEVTSNE